MVELVPVPDWQVWLLDVAPKINAAYFWLLMTAGFVVSVSLARALRSRGFYLVAIFFLSPVFSWGLREVQYRVHRDALEAYAAEQNRRIESGEMIPHIETTIRFPLFETCLVLGLLITLRASRRPNQALQPTPMLVTPRADARVAPSTGVADL